MAFIKQLVDLSICSLSQKIAQAGRNDMFAWKLIAAVQGWFTCRVYRLTDNLFNSLCSQAWKQSSLQLNMLTLTTSWDTVALWSHKVCFNGHTRYVLVITQGVLVVTQGMF